MTEKKKSKKKKLLIVVVIILVAALVGGFFLRGGLTEPTASAEYTEFTAQKGNVTVSISGSGSVTPIDQYEVVAMVSGDVLTDTFSEGAQVEKGDILYTIDSSEMEKTLEKANISLERQMMSYENSIEAYEGLRVRANNTGLLDEIFVSKGDNIQSGTKIATIIDNSKMTVRVAFTEGDAANLSQGQSVTVTVENTFEQLPGTITKVHNAQRVLDGYISVTDVDVVLDNPGALQTGTWVSVSAGSVLCYEPGQLDAIETSTVKAKASGTVEDIASQGTYVSEGSIIAELENEDAEDTFRSSQLSLREMELSYESSIEQLEDYTITAPISGSVISKQVKAGDTLDDKGTVMATIADMSVITFEISVDELDIASMEVGQEAIITADALPDQTFTGYVDNIGLLGTSSMGVTSYPVTIVINDPTGLWPGMNVTAEIIVDSTEDVLVVPVDAISRGNLILVKEESYTAADTDTSSPMTQSMNETAPEGCIYVEVSLGLNDNSYIEITGGLNEGAIVMVPVTADSTGTTMDMMMPGGMGGMSAMPSGGGMPGGGGMPPGM